MKWICDGCGAINAAMSFKCHQCNLDRPIDNGPHYAQMSTNLVNMDDFLVGRCQELVDEMNQTIQNAQLSLDPVLLNEFLDRSLALLAPIINRLPTKRKI